jgi:hypothetical protein
LSATVLDTRPYSVTDMVTKIYEDRMRRKMKLDEQDAKITEIIINNDPPTGRHRAIPTPAGTYLVRPAERKHAEPFKAPKSLFALLHMEDDK